MIKRILIVFFLCFTFLSSMDQYVPRSKGEREYLNKIRQKKLTLGVRKDYFANEKIDGKSLNDIIEDMLISYLGLNIEEKREGWEKIYEEFENGKIDMVSFLTKTNERESFAIFSNKLLEENLVVVSKNKPLNNPYDLKGLEINVTRDSIDKNFLERFKRRNDLDIEIKEVDDMELKKFPYFADTNVNTLGEVNKISVGRLPDPSIGLKQEYRNLRTIINNALDEKYNNEIEAWLKKRRNKFFKEKFYNSLTEEEKEYLKSQPIIKIGYADIEKMSNFSFKDNRFHGLIPSLLNCLLKKIDIQVIENEQVMKKEWSEIFGKFKNKEIDVLTLSKTAEREKDFIFTKKIYDINVFQIENLKNSSRIKKVGVIRNSIEESLAKEHFLKKNIRVYTNKNNMIADLKNNKLTTILSLNSDIYDKKRYDINVFESVPVNLALNKDNILLRNILDKAILGMVNLNEFMKISDLNMRKELLLEQEKHKSLISFITSSCLVLILLSGYQTLKSLKQKKKNEELLQDELTGLYSRRVYNEFCKNNDKLEGCAILLDLNNFKNVNDSYGHDYGDEILIEAAKHLKEVFKSDYVFRISGDEFYIFSCYKTNVELKLMKLERLFKKSELMEKYKISFSLGYYYKTDSASMRRAFKYADMAMYKSKKEKKGWYEEATGSFIVKNQRKKTIEHLLKNFKTEDFYPVFQGKYDLKTKKRMGVEALARWKNQELGDISPLEFIPVAEELGLIYKIDYKIAEESIKKVKELLENKKVEKNFRISFNILVETFKRDDIVEYILNLLDRYSVDGKNIEIEITESTFLKNPDDVIKKLNILKERGIYLSIDDFTAGYSTVGLLTTLPVDIIKFDKSLISSMNDDLDLGKNIYIGLTNMIKSLKFKVIAEGIETRNQFEFLTNIGVSYGQGYYFGKPERDIEKEI
ncbi:EAL domain-containing protein [Cetobacterium somerae]|uniref:EAL domain-containing protein n=1 Tax=Cetobacterium somerae TaxID=188913 RepID=UPI003D768EAD